MTIPFVDLQAQYHSIKSEVDQALAAVIADSAFIGGKDNRFVRAFEDQFADYVGVNHCIGCGNGTDSIEILLKAMGIGPGDEVIVPASSWISTSEAVGAVGATPVFVDVHPLYHTIDPEKIEQKITSKAKAIIPVHLYGLPADMDPILAIAKKYGLSVLEDCAQAHGALYKGRMVGAMGHAASFSFYPGKNLGAYGDAGCMVTNDEEIAKTARMIANHGQLVKHDHVMEGRNSRLDGIHAAILSVKLPHLKEWTELRIRHASHYSHNLRELGVRTPAVPHDSVHVYHLYVIVSSERDALQRHLRQAGIATAIHYPTPLPLLKPYLAQGNDSKDYPVVVDHMDKLLSLPMYPELHVNELNMVVKEISLFMQPGKVG
jgi:dTDP-4-amino-4,6-dideoxygalactose transaminase